MLTCLLCSVALSLSPNLTRAIDTANDLLDSWQLEDARSQAERILLQAPDEPAAQMLAAEVLHQQGRHTQALALWRSAQAQAPNMLRGQLLGPVVRASAGYAAHFSEDTTAHFIVHYINKDAILAAYATDVLESAYARIGEDLGFLPAERGEKIVVEIYPDARGLAGATGLTVKEIQTSGTIAVCKFHRLMLTSPLATAEGYAWADTLAHEFIHLIISKRSRNNIPVWFHEGVAKYFESRWHKAAGQALTPYAEQLLAKAQRKDAFVSFKQMHPSMAKLTSQEQAALAFAEVFTVVEYIVERDNKHAIAKILHRVGQGASLQGAFKEILGVDMAGLESAWKVYLKKRRLRELPEARPSVISLSDGQHHKTQERPLEDMADKQVHDWARLGELLQIRHRPAAAVIEYEKAIQQSGMRYASLVDHLARAYVELGQIQNAKRLLERSLGQHPDDSDAHLLLGRIDLKSEHFDTAQLHFEAARLQNPFNPEMHAALAGLYARQHKDALARQENHFLELCAAPRPDEDTAVAASTAPLLPPDLGRLRVVTAPWGQVVLDDGAPASAPIWDMPLSPGEHRVEMDHQVHRVSITAGQTSLCIPKP